MRDQRTRDHCCVSDISKAHRVAAVSDVAAVCAIFAPAQVLGFDLEWKAHAIGTRGSRGKVATLQLSDGLGNVALFHLTSLGGVPQELVALLLRARLAGVCIGDDLKKLDADYGVKIPIGSNVVELRDLASDVLRCPRTKVASLEAVFEECCPGRKLNKKLCHVGGPRFVDWESWPLAPHEALYALNDADAGALAARRLLFPQQQPAAAAAPTQLPPTPADLSVHAAAGAATFAAIDPSITSGLCPGGGGGDAADDDDDNDDDDDEQAAVAAGNDTSAAPATGAAASSSASNETRKTVVAAARDLIEMWDLSGDATPLELPSFLTSDDRAAVHAFCEQRSLAHETVASTSGADADRNLVVSRRPGFAGGQGSSIDSQAHDKIFDRLKFTELWVELFVKYDPRHFLGNWFLLAQSKSSSLF
ncbi:MAG TPA: hypothetical protein EYP98_02700, partial [Planctomycetes bacterium]|nr:hypothetical protein [Planctomycetota bacterium]